MTPFPRFAAGRTVRGLLILELMLLAGSASAAEATPEPMAQWIARLGSAHFAEREKASQALDAIGEPALALLEPASRSSDPEVRRRAGQLLRSIRKRVESTQLTAPRSVRLAYRDVPLADAVADFNRKTGFAVQVEGDPQILKGRTVTLDTGNATLWQALDQFGHGAGLTEWQTLPEKARSRIAPFLEARKKARPWPALDFLPPAANAEQPLLLVPGAPAALPVCEAGGLRVRALAHGTPSWGPTAACLLEIAPQPGMAWQGTQEVRVHRAVDDLDQRLVPVPPEPPAPPVSAMLRWRIAALQRRELYMAPPRPGPRTVEVRLENGPRPSRRLKQLEGCIIGRMIAPPETVLIVDRILQAAGGTFRRGPTSLRITTVKAMKDNHVLLEVEITHTPEDDEALGEMDGLSSGRFRPEDLRLRDAAGADYEVVQGMTNGERGNGSSLIISLAVLYRARAGQGDPIQLVLFSCRPVLVEVPFRLENVPLP